jgi:membrane protease YdiL (CAAX protease family)
LLPDRWEPDRAAAFAANCVVVVVVAPIVEELLFRGLGYSLLAPLGEGLAVVLVGLAFGLAHGLVEALPLLVAFGSALAYMRQRTDSVVPGMLVHGLFNGIALAAAVSGG